MLQVELVRVRKLVERKLVKQELRVQVARALQVQRE